MRKLCLAVLLAVLPACGGIIEPPTDPTPPPPPPPPWECPLAVPGCHELDPPQTCSTEESPCWHNPTTNPEHCEFASDCPPPPSTACVTESDLDPTVCPTPGAKFQDEVKEATDTLGDLRGRPPQENLIKLAEQLRVQMPGRCIIAGIEAVFIQRDDGTYEENHAVFFGNGAWTNSGRGVFVGCHEDTDPTEPPGGECVEPDPTGLEAEFNLKKHGQLWDSTYRIVDRGYCDAVADNPVHECPGFAGRNRCPVRCEGAPDREACEEQQIGDQKWWCDGTALELCAPDNPGGECIKISNRAQARCHGHVRTCTEDGVTCGEEDW